MEKNGSKGLFSSRSPARVESTSSDDENDDSRSGGMLQRQASSMANISSRSSDSGGVSLSRLPLLMSSKRMSSTNLFATAAGDATGDTTASSSSESDGELKKKPRRSPFSFGRLGLPRSPSLQAVAEAPEDASGATTPGGTGGPRVVPYPGHSEAVSDELRPLSAHAFVTSRPSSPTAQGVPVAKVTPI